MTTTRELPVHRRQRAIIQQLYFRQALAYLMNQTAIINGPLRGTARSTVGPVAGHACDHMLSPKGGQGDPFPYEPAKAKSLLASHGWNVVPNGTTTCMDPRRCGPGITKGDGMTFNFPYATGIAWIVSEMDSTAVQRGGPRNQTEPGAQAVRPITALAGGNCVVTKSSCDWDMANWGVGWSFSPDYLPTGEELFECGVPANSGGYCDKTNDALINHTLTSPNLQCMYSWQNYLAPRLPVEYQPNAAYTLPRSPTTSSGVLPQSPTLSITPEYWYFVS